MSNRDAHMDGSTLETGELDDFHCIIVSSNLKRCSDRLNKLLERTKSERRPPDIIAIQDPPAYFPFKECGNYIQWWSTADGSELTCKENPSRVRYVQPYGRKTSGPGEDLVPLEKVAFCIHKTLKNYTIIQAQGKNRGLLATLFLTTEHGNIAIHNLYNYERAADIDELIEACRDKTYAHIIIGDFNLRHKDWEGPTCRNPHPEANTLVQKAGAIGMTCVNKPGHFTYSRGEFKTPGNEYKSVIDLAFVSTLLVGHASHDVLDGVFDSDHRPIRVTLDLRVERRRNYRYLWSEVTNETFADLVEKLAADMDWTAPESESAALQMLQDFIIRVLDPAVRDLVPRELLNQPLPVNHRTWTSVGVRIKNSRSRIVKLMSGRRGVWSVVKRAACWSRPKRIAQTPAFEHRGRIYTSDSDKVRCYVESTWTRTQRKGPARPSSPSPLTAPSRSSSESQQFATTPASSTGESPCMSRRSIPPSDLHNITARPGLPLPIFSSTRPQHVALDKLEKDELKRILKDLPDGKAYGTDNIPYEALKKCRKVIEPILETIFNAFLQFRLHPDHFKETITFVIQKPGKDAKVPTSYRPIAILNTIGKVYERIIANRLKTLAQTHNLLPATQFGAPGRNTTLALEHLLNGVYRGWLCKSKVSLLSLDLSGAYDHVDREQLLDTLISKGIPDWLVQIVWSFLSNRRSFIHMPGFEGDEYWIDVGIPQGSPLSPLLFLFYSAPILAKFGKEYGPETVAMFSYVDDTYVLVGTASYGRNCKIMSEIHAKLYEWARQRNLRFSPAKFKVMHFVNKNERDWKQHMNCSDLPSVPGFSNMTDAQKKKVLSSELVVLGVTLDKCLTWVAHVEAVSISVTLSRPLPTLQQIREKVRNCLESFKRFIGPTWGADLIRNRQLYYGKILPTIAYAAPAWFTCIPSVPYQPKATPLTYGIATDALKILCSLQIECMLALSGARRLTSAKVLEKEMHILPIVLQLHRICMTHRLRWHHSPEYIAMRNIRMSASGRLPLPKKSLGHSKAVLQTHPYQTLRRCVQLDEVRLRKRVGAAFEKKWEDIKKRKMMIKEYYDEIVHYVASLQWRKFRQRRNSHEKFKHPAYEAAWMDHSLRFYNGLTRAQSSILIMMRTGNIALYGNPIHRMVKGSKDSMCRQCGMHLETSEHLLCHCKKLHMERQALTTAAGHNNFHLFMTTDCDLASAWAIRYFGLEQFKHVKDDKRYQFPLKRSNRLR
ncbi:hypothetical protein HBI07_073830 [Parastagonospora nodorum]|nr:hypothetical protein HBI84_006120 [Parastagonospora nodorum]KAH6546533.1 hypothetical protein HBI07_073830 [Parastagonospora nodorum]